VSHQSRSFFLDIPLQAPVESFAGELTRKCKGDFDFAGGVDEGGVDNAQALRKESKPGARKGNWVGGVLGGRFISGDGGELERRAYIVHVS